ncbi:MAG: hypothetical protein K8S87_08395, partial [Planctomycetes bacterium]|nr:hypothetical protein [Planctomycetota bacterium]
MKILYVFQISVLLAFFCATANAQFVTQTSARSLAMGGGAESLCDDPLSMLDNIASMGRNARERGQFSITFAPAKYYNYDSETMVDFDSIMLANIRIVIAPERESDNGKWLFWLNTASPSMTWEGILTDTDSDEFRVQARSSIKELGLGTGFAITDSIHVGIGLGATIVFAEWDSENLVTSETSSDGGLSFLPIPVVHLGLEFFLIPRFNVSVNALISGFNDTEIDEFDDVRKIDASYLSGPGVLQGNLSMAYELSPFLHVSGGYKLTMMNVPDWAEIPEDFEDMIHSASLGFEYILKIGGTSV